MDNPGDSAGAGAPWDWQQSKSDDRRWSSVESGRARRFHHRGSQDELEAAIHESANYRTIASARFSSDMLRGGIASGTRTSPMLSAHRPRFTLDRLGLPTVQLGEALPPPYEQFAVPPSSSAAPRQTTPGGLWPSLSQKQQQEVRRGKDDASNVQEDRAHPLPPEDCVYLGYGQVDNNPSPQRYRWYRILSSSQGFRRPAPQRRLQRLAGYAMLLFSIGAVFNYVGLTPFTGNLDGKGYGNEVEAHLDDLPQLTSLGPFTVHLSAASRAVRLVSGPPRLVLYRILGNDLPPRHRPGQTIQNLKFILNNEPAFPDTRKWWVLNRIVDGPTERTIINILERRGQDYIRIPFDEDEYTKRDFRLDDFPQPDYFHTLDYEKASDQAKLRVVDHIYHDKNLYVMNNNGGRNLALLHGKRLRARWILPFDGNCFLTANSFKAIIGEIERYGASTKYFVVPMSRVVNNTEVLAAGYDDHAPNAPEEPQLIFRVDATEMYNLNMRYGRRSKLEFLWRIGAMEGQPMANGLAVPWEAQEQKTDSPDKGNFRSAGWVYRLFSGESSQEMSNRAASQHRAHKRLLAVRDSLDAIDEGIARRRFRYTNLLLYNETRLQQVRLDFWTGDPVAQRQVACVLDEAAEAVEAVWKMGAEALKRASDGKVNHALLTSHAGFLDDALRNITTLAMAHYFAGEDHYAHAGANLARICLLGELPKRYEPGSGVRNVSFFPSMFPELASPQSASTSATSPYPIFTLSLARGKESAVHGSKPGRRFVDPEVLLKVDLSHVLDGFRLLRRANALTQPELMALQALATDYLEYLETSQPASLLARCPDHRGTFYDLQVAALAAFVDDVRTYLRVVQRTRMRFGRQFTPSGDQPFEAKYAEDVVNSLTQFPSDAGAHLASDDEFVRCIVGETKKLTTALIAPVAVRFARLNLQYWMLLTRAIQNAGAGNDLWTYSTRDGRRLSKAVVRHVESHQHRELASLSHLVAVARAAHRKAGLRKNPQLFGDSDDVLNGIGDLSPETEDCFGGVSDTACRSAGSLRPGWNIGIT